MIKLKASLLAGEPIGIDPLRASAFIQEAEAAQAKFAGLDVAGLAALLGNEQTAPVIEDGVAIVRASGVIGFDLSPLETAVGGLDLGRVNETLEDLAGDTAVKRVALVMDTPGGSVLGLQEAMGYLGAYPKPTAVFTRGLLASAGYFYASQADEIVSTPGAQVGNAGVYYTVVDSSAAFAANGLKVEVFKSGEYKAAGTPGVSLTDKQRAELQESVDEMGATLRGMTLGVRKFAKASALQGQTYSGRRAADLGLITGTVNSFAEFLARQKAKAAASA